MSPAACFGPSLRLAAIWAGTVRIVRGCLVGALGLAGAIAVAQSEKAPRRPNIIVILADDMGYSDVGCYGGEIATPNLDRLAAGGLRYRQFYNAGRCCPTRASLLTGVYPHQAGMGWMTRVDLARPGYAGNLSERCVTVAEVLKTAGYATQAVGKWHVALDKFSRADSANKGTWPLQRGFDEWFGSMLGGSYFRDRLNEGNGEIAFNPERYLTDALSDRVVDFIRKRHAVAPGQPFFSYLAYTAPHFPLHAKAEDIARYRERYGVGWEAIRRDRFKRMQELGVIAASAELAERPANVAAWAGCDPATQRDFANRMAIYAAQVDCMDQGIGRIVGALRETGQLNHTLILFLSDNGATEESPGVARLDEKKLGRESAAYRREWAHVSNTPFRLYKGYAHEGGIATPLIVHWPAGIAARGEWRNEVGHVIDLLPTLAEVAGGSCPPRIRGQEVVPWEGRSLVPSFAGGERPRGPLGWEHEGHRGLRDGDWKLVAVGVSDPWELYDLATDRAEGRNLAARHPEIVSRLDALWQTWAGRTGVLPLDARTWEARVAAAEGAPPKP